MRTIGMVLALLALTGGCAWTHVNTETSAALEGECGHIDSAVYGIPPLMTAAGQYNDYADGCRKIQEARALGTYANLNTRAAGYFVGVAQRQVAGGGRQAAPAGRAVDQKARDDALLAQAMARCAGGNASGCKAACSLGDQKACAKARGGR